MPQPLLPPLALSSGASPPSAAAVDSGLVGRVCGMSCGEQGEWAVPGARAAAPARGRAELSPSAPRPLGSASGDSRGSDQPLGRGHLDHVPHFHSGPVLLLPARAVGSLSRSPPLHGNRRGYNHCEEQGSPRSPDCSHHGGVAEVRPHSLLW